MDQTREWITPLEAALEMSMRNRKIIFPDDIKQMRLHNRLDSNAVMQISNRLWLYDRNYIVSGAPVPIKRNQATIERECEYIASWLEDFPATVTRLQEMGYAFYDDNKKNNEAIQKAKIIQKERQARRKENQSGRYLGKITKTA